MDFPLTLGWAEWLPSYRDLLLQITFVLSSFAVDPITFLGLFCLQWHHHLTYLGELPSYRTSQIACGTVCA
eukprot:NODE_7282_length_450_cov_1.275949.p4 GENE.NODE_7282_length_450_cov_1.275949~~NODE_7282_length_450_cov_1.275949.p4  ORF type:complete len:71 (+),score=9.76 NODE_7282_length_450_cov_1.275949:154-366(+)